ncbi:MAG: tetratricopeptide repeat protein [Desulfosudaceae bacterium]
MSRYYQTIAACLFLAALVTAVFYPLAGHDFLNMDDPFFVESHRVPEGLTPANIKRAFSMGDCMWMPLTWLSHMTDCQLYGPDPAGHHLTSLFLHLANTILLFLILGLMTGTFYKSLLVAGLFALHPLNVEAVAYIAARKGLLASFFWLLTILAYLGYTRRPSPPRYLVIMLCFLSGLMANPILVTLPLILLLLDYWPLNRLRQDGAARLIKEKLPLLAPAIIISLVSVITQQQAGALSSLAQTPLLPRLANALVNYVAYLGHLFWPADLAIFYPWRTNLPWWQPLAAALLLLAISRKVIDLRPDKPYAPVGWFWFLITLLPVIGIIRIGSHAMADRYAYLPAIGIFVVIVWGGAAFLEKKSFKKPLIGLAGLALLLALGTASRHQLGYWRNDLTVFEHALAVTDNNYAAHNNLARALAERGRHVEAFHHLNRALKINPDFPQAHNNLGVLLAADDPNQALKHFTLALQYQPDFAEAHRNMADVFFENGAWTRALTHYKKALAIAPRYPGAADIHYRIGLIMAGRDKTGAAFSRFKQALSLDPGRVEAAVQLARLYKNKGRHERAIEVYQNLLKHRSDSSASIAYNLACLYALKNDQAEAVNWLKKSVAAGLTDRELLKTDEDLANIRATPYYQSLVDPDNS